MNYFNATAVPMIVLICREDVKWCWQKDLNDQEPKDDENKYRRGIENVATLLACFCKLPIPLSQ
jgi:hypothetical protein